MAKEITKQQKEEIQFSSFFYYLCFLHSFLHFFFIFSFIIIHMHDTTSKEIKKDTNCFSSIFYLFIFFLHTRRISCLQNKMACPRIICLIQFFKCTSMDPVFNNCEHCAGLLQHIKHMGWLDKYDLYDTLYTTCISWQLVTW